MAVFYILLLVPVMIQHFTINRYDFVYERKNRQALTFFFAFLVFLLMFRHESVGTDTRNYFRVFNTIAEMDWEEVGGRSAEFGFSYIVKIITIITKEQHVFLSIFSICTFLMIFPTYKRMCVDASLTIVLFCTMSTFVMSFSGIRQMLALGIGFIAYEFTRKRKLTPFILCVILALSVHTSSFMLAFMYPLYHAKITRKWLFVVIPVLAVVFIFNTQIFSSLGFILEQYTKYDASITQTGAYTMLFLFAVFAVFSFVIPDESLLDDETIGLRNFLLLSLVVQMFAPLHTVAMRMSYYYIIFIPLLIPKIIECKSALYAQVAVIGRHIMVIFFLLYFFVNAYNGENLKVFPYHFLWESVS